MAEADHDEIIDDGNNTNLIINYLPQTLTDEEFQSMFLSIGPVKSSKIVRDKSTGYSYGFGFVDYIDPADAERAIQTLNGLQLQNKRIKVALARPGGDTIKGANLYVRNLPKSYTETELNEVFQPYGNIIQSRVLVDLQTGASKGVGFVLYDRKQEAELAISGMNGKAPPGGDMALLIKFADDNAKKVRPPSVPPAAPAARFPGPGGPMRNQGSRFRYNPMHGGANSSAPGSGPPMGNGPGYIVFCYNIGYDATEKTLWELFSPFGTCQKVNVIYDHSKNQCKGYGFVTMTNLTEALNAINCLNGYWYGGRQLSVSFKK